MRDIELQDPRTLPAPVPVRHARVAAQHWQTAAQAVVDGGGRLIALWGADRGAGAHALCAAYAVADGLLWLELELADPRAGYPGLSALFPCAGRMQRAISDLLGWRALGQGDQRPWLDHGAWPPDYRPLRADGTQPAAFAARDPADYPFVRVEGEGVHEIPVGPVHAGIIEPGHFRFSIVGEKVLRLEQRLGYKHKGIEQRFLDLAPLEGHRLAGRVSGDSTVAFAWGYCMALESIAGCTIPARAAWLRALMLERERIANHLGDLGALGNDGGFAFGLAQFSRLREDWQRDSQAAFGHRFMMDAVVPGGVALDPGTQARARLRGACAVLHEEVRRLRRIYDEHAGLQDRFITTGRVSPQLAAQLNLCGLAGRASAQATDLRCDHPFAPYDRLRVQMATHRNGDVAARVSVRFDEVFESLRLIEGMLEELPDGPVRAALDLPARGGLGAGWVEGWRGDVFVALELAARGGGLRIARCHCHDPSWQNWPVLEHAVIGNIVPDFPLINKSFNLSYAGQDL